jgi:hypothetical protein
VADNPVHTQSGGIEMSATDNHPISYYTGSDWPAEEAADLIDDFIASYKRQAKYLKENREGFATSEEEFRLLFEQGLGWGEEEIEDLVKEVRAKRQERENKKSAQEGVDV